MYVYVCIYMYVCTMYVCTYVFVYLFVYLFMHCLIKTLSVSCPKIEEVKKSRGEFPFQAALITGMQ